MNASTWLRDRVDGVPPALSAALQARVEPGTERAADILAQAAGDQLAQVLKAQPMTRAQALDLLAADAFATYALEAAADEPTLLAERADRAMKLFAEHVSNRDA